MGIFDSDEVITRYSLQEAIADGVLARLEEAVAAYRDALKEQTRDGTVALTREATIRSASSACVNPTSCALDS